MLQTDKNTLLEECRQMMTKQMRTSITGMLNEVDDTLLKMAQNPVGTAGSLHESLCYEAVREIRIKRTEIKLRFERRLINLFENEIKNSREFDKPASVNNDVTEKQFLFNNPEMEDNVSVKESAGEVRKSCAEILMDLDNRFSLLLEVKESINPLQPELVFESFRDACWDIKSGDEVRLMMFNIFERRITGDLAKTYQDINSYLKTEYENEDSISENTTVDTGKFPPEDKQAILLRYEMNTQIEQRLSGHSVPDFVHQFLIKHWRIFLEQTYDKYTENSIAWNAAKQTMDDLVESVGEITTTYDRERQIQILPSLLFRLLNGMKLIEMDEIEIGSFLKQLKNHQLESLGLRNEHLTSVLTEDVIESIGKYERRH